MIDSLQREYQKLAVKFLQISVREQLMVLFCGLILLVVLIYNLLLEPVLNTNQKLTQNTVNAEKFLVGLSNQTDTLTAKLKQDPNLPVHDRIASLSREITDLDDQLHTHTDNLVPANKMANMLETLLAQTEGLKLMELQSIAPTSILLDTQAQKNNSNTGLYRHGVALVFEGSYFDIQQYLEKIENLPWQFYWKKFNYRVGDYPTAVVEVEIYTLSTNKAFMGI
jgi:MSHA biogenesis protein MshJ